MVKEEIEEKILDLLIDIKFVDVVFVEIMEILLKEDEFLIIEIIIKSIDILFELSLVFLDIDILIFKSEIEVLRFEIIVV